MDLTFLSLSVIVFATFATVDEAIELANASSFSLTSSVWSADIMLAQEVAYQIRYSEFINLFLQLYYLTFVAKAPSISTGPQYTLNPPMD